MQSIPLSKEIFIILSILPTYLCFSCLEDYGYDTNTTFRYCQSPIKTSCECHNIHFNGKGDGDCSSMENGVKWCYIIGSMSQCKDKKVSALNNLLPKGLETIYYSEEACANFEKQENFGNEEFLPGFEIIGSDLSFEFGGGGFNAPTPEACETECFVRESVCSAWTFIINPEGKKSRKVGWGKLEEGKIRVEK